MMQVGLILILLVDLFGIGRRYFSEHHLARSGSPAVETYDLDRFIKAEYQEAGGAGSFRVLSLELNQTSNARPSFHHESLGGYSGAKLRIYQDFLDNLLYRRQSVIPNLKVLDMMNVRYVITPYPVPGLDVAFADEQRELFVLENQDMLPRAFLVGNVEVARDSQQEWDILSASGFEPDRMAVLGAPLDTPVVPMDSTSVVSVNLLEYGPRAMSWARDY